MGFYFGPANGKPKSKKRPSQRQARATPQNAATLQRLGCRGCPLNNASVNSPKMQPTIPKKTSVYFLAEAPGKVEDEEGKPLIGPSGQLLRSCIPSHWRKHCAYDNIIRDRPPENRDPAWQEIECCRNHVIKSIEEAKPDIVVGIGKHSLNWMLRTVDQKGMRGRKFAVQIGSHSCWFIPIYHPAFILRNAYDKDKPLASRMGKCFEFDIQRVFDLADLIRSYPKEKAKVITPEEAKSNITIYTGQIKNSVKALIKQIREARRAVKSAIDLETWPLRPYVEDSKILSTAISYYDKSNVQRTFSFAIDHKDAGWSKREYELILDEIYDYVKENKGIKIAQNVPFENEWLISYYGLDIVDHHGWEDTMMQAHFIDERKGEKPKGEDVRAKSYQSLNFLTQMYFGLPIKTLFDLNMKDLRNAPLDKLLLYGGVDAKHELKLHDVQETILENDERLDVFRVAVSRQPTVAVMQSLGINVDQNEIKRHKKKLEGEISDIETDIGNLKVIKGYKKDHGSFNPGSQKEVLAVFKDYLKRSEIKVPKKHPAPDDPDPFRYSVDKNVLGEIDHPLANLITRYRNRVDIKSTNVDQFELPNGKSIFSDGLIHYNLQTTFTETGRTSCDNPNMQNWPKRNDSWVRSSIVPGPGRIFIAVDYGQLEFCTTAICTKDKKIINAIYDGYDVHMEWAERIAHQYPRAVGGKKAIKDKGIMKGFRSRIKNKMVFPAIFGARNESIAGYLNMPLDEVDIFMDIFYDEFEGLTNWQNRIMKTYYREGYVESPTGRRRYYPLTKNEAINHPIQSVAADIVCDSMCRLSEYAIQTDQIWLHPRLNIHDDLTFSVEDNDRVIEESIETIYRYMLGIPFDFINVPLSVGVSLGYTWFDQDEVGKFYSNKDL